MAITSCGVGECHETANRVLFELMKQGIKHPISLVMVEGSFNQFQLSNYDHVFILVGQLKNGLQTVKDLSSLSDEVIIIDSLLNVVGKANNYKNLIGSYLDTHQIYNVRALNTVDPTKIDHVKISENARRLTHSIQEDIKHHDYSTAAIKSMKEVFSDIINTDSKLHTTISHIVAVFDGHEQQSKITDSLNTNMEAAFRQVCAYGDFSTISYMLDNKRSLLMFDANEPSPTTNARAKDWVNKNKRLTSTQRGKLLERIGADDVGLYKQVAAFFNHQNGGKSAVSSAPVLKK